MENHPDKFPSESFVNGLMASIHALTLELIRTRAIDKNQLDALCDSFIEKCPDDLNKQHYSAPLEALKRVSITSDP